MHSWTSKIISSPDQDILKSAPSSDPETPTFLHLIFRTGLGGRAHHVEMVVERDLVRVADDLVEGGVVKAGGQVTEEAGEALAAEQDVTVHAENEDEPVHGLQHHLSAGLANKKPTQKNHIKNPPKKTHLKNPP